MVQSVRKHNVYSAFLNDDAHLRVRQRLAEVAKKAEEEKRAAAKAEAEQRRKEEEEALLSSTDDE
eukprot:gene19847-33233_t